MKCISSRSVCIYAGVNSTQYSMSFITLIQTLCILLDSMSNIKATQVSGQCVFEAAHNWIWYYDSYPLQYWKENISMLSVLSSVVHNLLVILYFSALKKIRRTTVDEIEDDISIVEDDFLQSIQSHSIAIKIRLPSGVKKFKIKQVLNPQSINYILYSNLPCRLLSPAL